MPSRRSPVGAREPITVDRIVRTALDIVQESGYAALSMRAVAARLDTGQASLYAHVRNKAELDGLLIARVFDSYQAPEGATWRERLAVGAAHLLETYARYPGLAAGAFASQPTSERFLDDLEGDVAGMRAAGLEPREAMAVQVALSLVVAARSMEDAVIAQRIAESGLTADEWWERARQVWSDDPRRYPSLAEHSAWLDPESRATMAAEVVELVLDGAQARYGI